MKNKKYNNESKYFKNWTTNKLKEEAVAYDQMIYEIGCYGTRDLMTLQGIAEELEKRGVDTSVKISFNE